MIRRVFSWSPQLGSICDLDVFGTRTLGYFRTYGTDNDDVAFYAQYAEDKCVGVLSDAFGHGALTVTADADTDEWRQFSFFLGLHSLLCDKTAAASMRISLEDSGHILQYFGTERKCSHPFLTPRDSAFSYREIYDLLCECGFSLGDYTAWLADFALRVQKGAAHVHCIRDERAVAEASILFESENAVYLGAVATHPGYRGRGLAGDLVLSLAQCGKRAQILCRPHRVSFYESLGFRRNGEFVLCPSFR